MRNTRRIYFTLVFILYSRNGSWSNNNYQINFLYFGNEDTPPCPILTLFYKKVPSLFLFSKSLSESFSFSHLTINVLSNFFFSFLFSTVLLSYLPFYSSPLFSILFFHFPPPFLFSPSRFAFHFHIFSSISSFLNSFSQFFPLSCTMYTNKIIYNFTYLQT